MDVFHEKRRAGKTIVLVTHDMATVQSLCHRAMLIHDGELRYVGDPEETAMRYYRLNFGGADGLVDGGAPRAVPDVHARLVDAWLENDARERVDNVEQGTPIRVNILLEAREELASPLFALHVLNADGTTVFGVDIRLSGDRAGDPIPAGGQVRISGRIDNPLVPGRYFANCFVYREGAQRGALQAIHLPDFVVYGTSPGPGIVSVAADVDAVAERVDGA
jgi:hypothetical protein